MTSLIIKNFIQRGFKMAKKLGFLGLLIIFCSFSLFANDFWSSVSDWFNEGLDNDELLSGCSATADGIYYNGDFISIKKACDAFDKALTENENMNQAGVNLALNINNILLENKVPENIASKISSRFSSSAIIYSWFF